MHTMCAFQCLNIIIFNFRCYVVSLPYPEIVGACYIFYASLLIITSCVGFATATTKLGHRQGGLVSTENFVIKSFNF